MDTMRVPTQLFEALTAKLSALGLLAEAGYEPDTAFYAMRAELEAGGWLPSQWTL